MDEMKIEGERLPRFRLFVSNAKREPTGEPVCESDNLDNLRVFRRHAGRRYVLYEFRNRIPLNNLDVEPFTDLRSAIDTSDGYGWYCNNTKCRMLIAANSDTTAGIDQSLVTITCPHCRLHDYYWFSDFGWKKWRLLEPGLKAAVQKAKRLRRRPAVK